MSQENTITIDTIRVSYKIAGEGQQILVLHGWGSSSDSWVAIQEQLAGQECRVIALDLPGFGRTNAPQEVWGVGEYAAFVHRFAQEFGLEKFVLLGHSFGGQIAIQYAVNYPENVHKLVLVAAAGVRRTPGVAKKAVASVAKLVSFMLYLVPSQELRNNIKHAMYMAIRRRDYVRTQGVMRDIFKKVITQDLTALFGKVQMPTLIVWGDKDELTPVQDAHLIHELIPDSRLEIIENGKHALNFQYPEKLVEKISAFI